MGNNILDTPNEWCYLDYTMTENALPRTEIEAVRYFADEQTCIDFVKSLRWADAEPVCPHCGNNTTYFLETRKIFKCKAKECRKQFSIKTGTIFEDSALKLDKWLIAIWKIANAKNGISSYELSRALGITQKSAWFVNHRIREAMVNGTIEKMSGTIEMDEAFIGGDAKNMHQSKRQRFQPRWTRQHKVREHKTAVFGMVQRGGKVRAKVIAKGNNPKTEDVMPLIEANIEQGSEVFTDQAAIYRKLYEQYVHDSVNHAVEYVRGNVHTNSIENFWSLLKRTIKGTYVSVSPSHLQKYVEEQMFRYNEREGNDQYRFVRMIESISGKRLTYAALIGYSAGRS